MINAPEKTLHCLQMMRCSRLLAECAQTDHRRRILARYAYVFCEPLIKFGLSWRKDLARSKADQKKTRVAKAAIKKLIKARDNQGPIRHKLAAKRQELAQDRSDDALATNRLWAGIHRSTMEELCKQAEHTAAALCDAADRAIPKAPTANLSAANEALAALEPKGGEHYLVTYAGSYGMATEGALVAVGGGDVGRRIGQINDVVDQLRTLEALTGRLPVGDFTRLHAAAAFAEMSALLDLTIGPPAGFDKEFDSLIDVLEMDLESDGRAVLIALAEDLPAQLREETRVCRNALGAHVDSEISYEELILWLEEVDAAGVCQSATNIVEGYLDVAGAVDPLLGLLVLPGPGHTTLVRDASLASPAPWDAAAPMGPATAGPIPKELDSRYASWVQGPGTTIGSAVIAGMIAGRARRVHERLQASGERNGQSHTAPKG